MNATTDFEAIYITQAAIRDFEYKQVWREETKSARPRRSLETVLRRFGGYTRAPVPVTERIRQF